MSNLSQDPTQSLKDNAQSAMNGSYSWDQYFMTMAYLVSMKSKDPNTRVGAVIVGQDQQVIATGYNGFARGVIDLDSRYADKSFKSMAINHAEENAILHCARLGIASRGCMLYTPWLPCSSCARAIIQAGIAEVIYDENFPGNATENQKDWQQSICTSGQMLSEAGVLVRGWSDKIVKISGRYKSLTFPLL